MQAAHYSKLRDTIVLHNYTTYIQQSQCSYSCVNQAVYYIRITIAIAIYLRGYTQLPGWQRIFRHTMLTIIQVSSQLCCRSAIQTTVSQLPSIDHAIYYSYIRSYLQLCTSQLLLRLVTSYSYNYCHVLSSSQDVAIAS